VQASPIHKLPPRMMADAVVGFTGLGTHSNVVRSPALLRTHTHTHTPAF
jgi:hypothetical protein